MNESFGRQPIHEFLLMWLRQARKTEGVFYVPARHSADFMEVYGDLLVGHGYTVGVSGPIVRVYHPSSTFSVPGAR